MLSDDCFRYANSTKKKDENVSFMYFTHFSLLQSPVFTSNSRLNQSFNPATFKCQYFLRPFTSSKSPPFHVSAKYENFNEIFLICIYFEACDEFVAFIEQYYNPIHLKTANAPNFPSFAGHQLE